MIGVGSIVLSAAVWTGTAQVDVMIWEPGGEHPYTTDFELTYREAERDPMVGREGAGYSIRLIPEWTAITVHHEVRHADGKPICKGGGREVLHGGPESMIVLRASGASPPGLEVPTPGAYQLVLPRAVGAFACGTKRNDRDRRVVIGSGLFHPVGEIDAADSVVRTLDSGGLLMRGMYEFSDASRGSAVRHDYRVRWELRRGLRD